MFAGGLEAGFAAGVVGKSAGLFRSLGDQAVGELGGLLPCDDGVLPSVIKY